MENDSGMNQTVQASEPKLQDKRKYVPPRLTRLLPFKSTYGGTIPNPENVPTANTSQ
jgi:hypothetical protein